MDRVSVSALGARPRGGHRRPSGRASGRAHRSARTDAARRCRSSRRARNRRDEHARSIGCLRPTPADEHRLSASCGSSSCRSAAEIRRSWERIPPRARALWRSGRPWPDAACRTGSSRALRPVSRVKGSGTREWQLWRAALRRRTHSTAEFDRAFEKGGANSARRRTVHGFSFVPPQG